jgi:hypothetical protein
MPLPDFLAPGLAELLLGFAVNLFVALVIVRGIYYPLRHDKNDVFTFVAFNTVIFFVMTYLANAQLSVGVGFGLFAIFSVLRYRASAISTREMTYLFILIALPVMNSVLMSGHDWLLLAVTNLLIVGVLYVLERGWGFRYEGYKIVKYDRIDLLKPENHGLLLEDLRRRTGLPLTRFEIGRINLVEDTVTLLVFFAAPPSRLRDRTRAPHLSTEADSYFVLDSD